MEACTPAFLCHYPRRKRGDVLQLLLIYQEGNLLLLLKEGEKVICFTFFSSFKEEEKSFSQEEREMSLCSPFEEKKISLEGTEEKSFKEEKEIFLLLLLQREGVPLVLPLVRTAPSRPTHIPSHIQPPPPSPPESMLSPT